jgi:hypothetical protein
MRQVYYSMTSILLGVGLSITACTGPTGPPGATGAMGSSYPTPTPVCSNPSSQGLTAVGVYSFAPLTGILYPCAVTLSNPETATEISILTGSGAVTGQIRFGIYNDNGSNYPGGLVYQTNPQNLVSNSWNQASLPAVFLPAGTYWLAYELSTTGNSVLGNSSGGDYYAVTNGWAVMPSTFPSGAGGPFAPRFDFFLATCP